MSSSVQPASTRRALGHGSLWASAAMALSSPALAQETSPASPSGDQALVGRDPTRDTEDTPVEEIIVKGQALRGADNAFSTTTFSNRDIKDRRVTEVEQLFREVPGMNARDYNLSGVANQIVIRGFGNGGHGGDLGMVIDGIPLNEANSHADGYVDTNVLVPLEVGGLTVYRGPVSALYGNFNRGGLIAYETRKGGEYVEADVSGGSFRTFDAQAALGMRIGASGQLNGALQAFRSDGFRPQSDNHRVTGSGRLSWALTSELDFAVSARVQRARGDSPAYLTLEQFKVDPYGIDPRVKNDGSKKNFGTFRSDLAYTLTPDVRLLAFAYTTQQKFKRFFTRGAAAPTARWRQREEAYDRSVYGGGASLNGRSHLALRPLTYVFGVEAFSEDTQFQFYEDLDFRRRTAPAQFNRTLGLKSTSAFGEANVELDRRLELSLGARYDRFTGDCQPDGVEVPGGNCERFEAVDSFSPKIGVRSQILSWLQLRTSYSRGFALPEAQAKFQTGAQGLQPNRITQIEAGARLNPLPELEFDVVGYRIRSSNEFASPAPGEFINFGTTMRDGIEVSAQWRPSALFDLRAVYSHTNSEVRRNLDPNLIGRMVTGVPDNTATIYASWTPIDRLRLNATYRYVGEHAANASNTLFSPDYTLFDVGISYELDQLLATSGRAYLNIDNVANKVYASSFNSLASVATGTPRFVRVGVQFGF